VRSPGTCAKQALLPGFNEAWASTQVLPYKPWWAA
jgi:hypothetical protein